MNFELIVACNKKGIIGNNNNIPWYIPEDLKFFRDKTINNIVIMGRKTFESLPNKILKNRLNIVITNNYLNYNNIDNKLIFTNMDNFNYILPNDDRKIFIIGGNNIYKLFFNKCNIINLTIINNYTDGDTLFPYNIDLFNNSNNYKIIYNSNSLFSINNNIEYQHIIYELNK